MCERKCMICESDDPVDREAVQVCVACFNDVAVERDELLRVVKAYLSNLTHADSMYGCKDLQEVVDKCERHAFTREEEPVAPEDDPLYDPNWWPEEEEDV